MSGLFADARVRLVARAVLAGVVTTVTIMSQADDPFSTSAWKGAVVAGGWVVVEAITPLNALVGWFKNPV